MNYTKIVCLDLEQCCWEDRSAGDIIQIGLAEIDLLTGIVSNQRSFIVSPVGDEISPYCVQLTGLTHRAVTKQGRPLADVLTTIYNKVGTKGRIFCAWGGDFSILRAQCARDNVEYRFKTTLNLSTLFHIKIANLQQGRSVHKFSLEKAVEHFGGKFTGKAHDAMVDAVNTCTVAKHLLS